MKANEPVKVAQVDYASFGDKISAEKALTKEQMLKRYNNLKSGDTINVKFTTHINDVCKKKGCWMSLELPDGKESFVKFKDYAFFVPLNAAGQDAVVSGKAFVSEISVSQLRHYAKDGGKSEEEIAKITKPEVTYGFLADGVLISK
ncbi:branched-chain amino acid aminotransferase [Flavobacterium akiainvivens]|uniref:Branched-chain amino acid aminotransferase n=1 Tax=Flavobacterium akiainvivens TaxID=1202724 RepID=A0A0M8MCM1_9FLAO|nr:branched-chain amino acid aminotransferase [Flavobacterium akiainvivens]